MASESKGTPAPTQWMKVAEEIRRRFYAKDADRGYGPNPPRMLLTDEEVAEIIAAHCQAPAPADPVRLLLIRAITEMSYMHCAEVLSLVRSAEGEAIIEEGMKLIGLKDLSEEELARVRNGEVGNGKR